MLSNQIHKRNLIPDAEPYRLVLTAMQASRKVLAGIEKEEEWILWNATNAIRRKG